MGTTPGSSECGELPGDDLGILRLDELVEAVRLSEQHRRVGRERTGRLLAELYRRGQMSWPAIARETGIKQTTAYDLAQPYLLSERDDEASSE